MLAIDHAHVITPQGVIGGHVLVVDGTIAVVEEGPLPIATAAAAEVVDAGDGWLSPGFIDLQVNGGSGIDLTSEPTRIGELGRLLPRSGVTAFLPTIISCPPTMRARALESWPGRDAADPPGAVALGLHLEGPMLSPARRGAHPAASLALPSAELIDGWSAASGVVMVTLAPELPGALEAIAALRSRGVVVAIGHTDCSAATFRAARDAGATYVTHLFNAMRPFAHRDPGPIGAALADNWAVVGLICDGVHVDPVAVAMAWQGRGPDRLTLVSDAVAAAGAGGASSRLGAVDVVIDDGSARTREGALAGGTSTLDQAVRNLIAFTGCGVSSAIRTVTSTPARVLGDAERGSIQVGRRADLVVLDANVSVRTTIIGGDVVWQA